MSLVVLIHHFHPEVGGKVTQAFPMKDGNRLRISLATGGSGLTAQQCEIDLIAVMQSGLTDFPERIRFLGSPQEFLRTFKRAGRSIKEIIIRKDIDVRVESMRHLEIYPGVHYTLTDLDQFGCRWEHLSSLFSATLDESHQRIRFDP